MDHLRELNPLRTVTRHAVRRRAGALPRLSALPGLVTREAPGNPAGAAGVREADTARPVFELWDTAGALPADAAAPCGCGKPVGSSAAWGVEDGDVRHG